MATKYDFTWSDFIMTVGGHLTILVCIAFLLLSDISATMKNFPSANVREMMREMVPSAPTLAK